MDLPLKKALRLVLRRSTRIQRAYRWYRWYRWRSQSRCYPDWEGILARDAASWRRYRETAAGGPRVLIAASIGGLPSGAILDSLLSVALTLRGAEVDLLLCDGFLPACLMAEIGLLKPADLDRHGPQRTLCKTCFPVGNRLYQALGLKLHRYSTLVTEEEARQSLARAREVDLRDILDRRGGAQDHGEHALAGALRYFARANLDGQARYEAVLRRYYQAALLTALAARRLIRENRYAVVSCINGIYVPQGIVSSVAREEGCRVVTWNVAYRKRSFIFSHGDTYHHTLMSEPVSAWEGLPWDEGREEEIMGYLKSRRRGGRDWIVFHDKNPEEDLRGIARSLGLDLSRPWIGMLTNVAWDAQLHYPANAFPDMMDWIVKTIRWFAGRPDLQLIIRVHPAEVSGDIPSRQPVVEEVRKRFPALPRNVFLIPPQSSVSTYALMEASNAVILYGTKTGVEVTSLGIPVIVAGEAWIRGKGITLDARSADHYFEILDLLPFAGRMDADLVRRARRYAYHFFFRRMIPISQVEPTGGEPQFRLSIAGLEDLKPGRGMGLDLICDGILKGAPFIYPAERVGSSG